MIGDFWLMVIIVTVSGFVMEAVDAAIGMGYGTILVPVLLMVGFSPFSGSSGCADIAAGGGFVG